jgi:hypothetical protein
MTASLRWIGASLLACAVALTGPGVRPANACHTDEDEAAEAEREAAEVEREAAEEAREAAEEAREAAREADEAAECSDCDHDEDEDEDEAIEVEAEVALDSDRIDQLLEQVNRLLETQLDQLLDRLGDLESGGAAVWMEVELD